MSPAASRLHQVRARLSLPTVRRATGLLEGRHQSVFHGHGQDFDDLHLYHPGDSVSDIDWRSSARNGAPVVKRYKSTSNITQVLVADTGRHMAATAASGESKAEVAAFAAAVTCHLANMRGDRVALVAGDAGRLIHTPARAGATHLEVLLRRIEQSYDPEAPPGDLARLLDRVLRHSVRRSLVVIVTDEARPTAQDADALRRLRTRHDALVLQVADAAAFSPDLAAGAPGSLAGARPASARAARRADTARPAGESGPVRDVDSGTVLPGYLRGRRRLDGAVAAARIARHDEVTGRLRSLGVEHLVAEGTNDVIDEVVAMLARMRRAGR